jgi:hypothetical protein
MITEAQEIQFNIFHAEFVAQVQVWKREWLRQSPPMECVHYLGDPAGNTEKRQREWDVYVIPRSRTWWGERGWTIQFGEPNEGCQFIPISQIEGAST